MRSAITALDAEAPSAVWRSKMHKLFRAVPLDNDDSKAAVSIDIAAGSDFGALEQAKQSLGSDTPFVLWEGERRVLSHRPIKHLMQAFQR